MSTQYNKTRDGTGDMLSPVVSLERLSLEGDVVGSTEERVAASLAAPASVDNNGGATTSAPVIVGNEAVNIKLTVLEPNKPGPSTRTQARKEGGAGSALATPLGSGRVSPALTRPSSPASSRGDMGATVTGRKRVAPGRGGRRGRRQASPGSDTIVSLSDSPPCSPLPRKRGRPVTTGEFVGLAAAKRQLAEAEERALKARADKELFDEEKLRREERALYIQKVSARERLNELDPADPKAEAARRLLLLREVGDAVTTVTSVATTSRNLSGQAVRALKVAASAIRDAAGELGSLQATEEVRRLERDKEFLQRDLDRLEKELAEVKARDLGRLERELAEVRARLPGIGVAGEGGANPPTPRQTPSGAGRSAPAISAGDGPPSTKALGRLKTACATRAAAVAARRAKGRDPMDPAGFPPLPSSGDHSLMDTGVEGRPPSPVWGGRSGASSPLPPAASGLSLEARLEGVLASAVRQMSEVVDARVAALEARLPPERSFRPPLAHERAEGGRKRPAPALAHAQPPVAPSTQVEDSPGDWRWESQGRRRKRKSKGGKGSVPELFSPVDPPPRRSVAFADTRLPPNAPAPSRIGGGAAGRPGAPPSAPKKGTGEREPPSRARPQEIAASYARVAAKQRPPGRPTPAAAARTPGRAGGPGPSGPSGPGARPGPTPPATRRARRKAPRRAAAVTITLLPQTGERKVTLAEALGAATQVINLSDLGIESLRPKRAATGGLILEVPGEDSAPRADSLAGRLEAALIDYPVRIGRPVKRTDIRLTGLDDAATAATIATAVAAAGGCREADVRVGKLTRSPRGLLAATVSCPERAAYRAASLGKIKVGWVTARVTQLLPRPLQCHRCMAFGHVRVACKAAEDRSDACYRCGQSGHLAADCSAPANCLLCRGAGRQADHRMGGQACGARKGPKKPAPAAGPSSKGGAKAPAKAPPRGGAKRQEPKGGD